MKKNNKPDSGYSKAESASRSLERLRNAEKRLSSIRTEIESMEMELRKMARQMGVRSSLERSAEPHPPESTSRTDAPVIEAPVTSPKEKNS